MGLHLEDGSVVYVDSGEAALQVDEKVLTLGSGDRVLVPRGTLHTMRNPGSGPLSWLAAFPPKAA